MKFSNYKILFLVLSVVLASCNPDPDPPVVDLVDPEFAPVETLVTVEGANLENISEITFSGQPINFNNAYNADNALLLRIPTDVPVATHTVELKTMGGTTSFEFRVTEDAPAVTSFSPESSSVGDQVTLLGRNFFEPLEVLFHDSIAAEIIYRSEDSLIVTVPAETTKGRIVVKANGGRALSVNNFFISNEILINDFDGNGVRSDTYSWLFVGNVNENAFTTLSTENPAAIDGTFMKISGQDDLDISWIGGAENHAWDTDVFENFGINATPNNVLLEMDLNSNGRENTNIILILLERDGSPNDFAHNIKVDWEGWKTISIPLNRFEDLNGIIVDPTKVKTVKVHLIDSDDSNQTLEVNVDNMKFLEII